jgi:signal peptidase II
MKERWPTAAIIAVVVLIDRVTKLYIRASFSPWDIVPVIPQFFNIVHTENPGAAFGMLADSTSQWRGVFLVGISLVVMALIAVMLWRPHHAGMHDTLLLRIGLSLVFGGALGNVWDRLFRGTVTDFLQIFFGSYEFPSFNAADSAITIGAVLLLIDLWRTRHRHPPDVPAA